LAQALDRVAADGSRRILSALKLAPIFAKRLRCVASGLALAALILIPTVRADTLRVVTWNLEPSAAPGATNAPTDTNPPSIRQAAAALKELAPDVILLQQVRDWKMCDQLAQALKPADYKILICSSFTDARTGTLRNQQVAILSKAKAYLAWSEPWRTEGPATLPGGLAFAALQIGKQRVGLFSVLQAGATPAKEADPGRHAAAVSQLLEQVSSIKNWVTNRVQVFVAGGTFNPATPDGLTAPDTSLRLLEEAGFGNAFPWAPVAERNDRPGGMADNIFTQPAGSALNPRIAATPAFMHPPMTCEVELDPSKAAPRIERPPKKEPPRSAKANEVKAASAPIRPLIQPGSPAPATSQPSTLNPQLLWPLAGGIFLAFVIAWMFARRRRALPPATPALLTEQAELPSSYTVVVGTRSATEPDASQPAQPLIHIDAPETHTHAEVLRQRALAAEQRADSATAVIRAGLIPHLSHWLKQKLVRKLVTDRAQLLAAQQAATLKALAVEERLATIEQQIRQQNQAYQERIEELTRELIAAKEGNREMIRARIAQVKRDMEAASARLMARSAPDDAPLA
jgi:hypothetical protein